MGAVFWYKPNGTTVREVLLNRAIGSRSEPSMYFDQEIQRTLGGNVYTQMISGTLRIMIRFQFEIPRVPLTGSMNILRRELVAMLNHLQRGGTVAFAEEQTYAYATSLVSPPLEGSTVLAVNPGNVMPYASAVNLSGRELYIQTDASWGTLEMSYCTVDAHAGGVLTTSTTRPWGYNSDGYLMVREAGSYPALRLIPTARNSEMLKTDDDRVFDLTLELEEDTAALAALLSLPNQTTPGYGTDTSNGGPPIDLTDPQAPGGGYTDGLAGGIGGSWIEKLKNSGWF